MREFSLFLAFLGLVGGLSTGSKASAAAPNPPPATRKDDTVETYWGVNVPDPYRWLEAADAPAVKHWIEAQNSHTEQVLSSFPQGAAIAKRVQALSLTSTQRSEPELVAGRLFFLQQTPPQPQPVLVWQKWPKGEIKVLVDPNQTPGVAITGYWPSPNGRLVAYGTAEGGSEATTIHVVEVATGRLLPDSLPFAGGGTTPQGVAWDADSKGFVYVRLPLPGTVPAAEEQFYAALFHHALRTPALADPLSFGRDLSPVAEYSFTVSSRGRHTAMMVHFGDGNPARVYLRTRAGWREVLGTNANVRAGEGSVTEGGAATWLGDRLLVISYEAAPRGKLLAINPVGAATTLVPQGAEAIHGIYAVKSGFLLVRVAGPEWRLDQYKADGTFVRRVPLPPEGIGIGAIAASSQSTVALVSFAGWTFPNRWDQYDIRHGTLKTIFAVKPAADYSRLRTYRLTARSRDGTRIPVTVVATAGVRPDGKRPSILYGYGGYGIVIPPHFMGPYLAWLEKGGVYALANIRGGSAYGEGWHEAGMLANKQNDFDDFYAAAQALVAAHWTGHDHLGILGGSNGGLLMGAELTQHPAEYRAVVSFVGIYDMLRAELWPNGRYNISEYGTVTQKPDFDWLYAYSPLQHVKPGVAYPAVLLVTGVNDPRVAPWQSRKFAAALQAATASERPILLLTRMNEGHGVTASFSQRVGNTAAALTFFAHELGLEDN
jgi:prolyl oligopeptidase